MTRFVVRTLVASVLTVSLANLDATRAVAFDPPTEEQLNQLKQQADEAKARKDTAATQLKGVQDKAKALSDEIAKLKTSLTMATTALKSSEEKLKPAQEAATKAEAAKVEAAKVFTAAKTASDAAAKAAEEALKKSKDEEAKAAAALKAATDAAALVTTTTQTIEVSKKTITDATAGLTKLDADVKAFQPEVQKASEALASINSEWVTKQRAVEGGLIALNRMVSFSHSIAPIFAKRCLACHNAHGEGAIQYGNVCRGPQRRRERRSGQGGGCEVESTCGTQRWFDAQGRRSAQARADRAHREVDRHRGKLERRL